MNNVYKYCLLICLSLLCALGVMAQMPQQPVEMADTMRSNGKIFVVVAVLTTILAGLIWYLVRLEKRIKQLEKNQ
jgi:prolipoprotein diacylglyceryltransferase